MAQTLAQSFYLGPFAVYTSPAGLTDPVTGLPELGGTLHEGDYVDVTASEAAQWNVQFGTKLYAGRYRFVRVGTAATSANLAFGVPVGIAKGTSVAQVVLAAAGSSYTAGNYTVTSSTSGGIAATATVVVNASGAISSVQLLYPGANFTSVPTFGLTELPVGSGGSVLLQMAYNSNFVTSFDSSAVTLSVPRGVALCTPTAAQIAASCYIVIQELGIAPILVTTATATAAGAAMAVVTGGAVTTTTPTTTTPVGFFGYTLDIAAAGAIVRAILNLPVWQG
jgi:hypothetical protein